MLQAGLEGSEEFYKQEFNTLIQQQKFDEASKIVAQSPGIILRNINTINILKNV